MHAKRVQFILRQSTDKITRSISRKDLHHHAHQRGFREPNAKTLEQPPKAQSRGIAEETSETPTTKQPEWIGITLTTAGKDFRKQQTFDTIEQK